jgi:hypothetical protein
VPASPSDSVRERNWELNRVKRLEVNEVKF